jgi:hypothetical protein
MVQFRSELPVDVLREIVRDVQSGRPETLLLVQKLSWCTGCLATLIPPQKQRIFGCQCEAPAEFSMRELLTQISAVCDLADRARMTQQPVPASNLAWLISVLFELGLRMTLGSTS